MPLGERLPKLALAEIMRLRRDERAVTMETDFLDRLCTRYQIDTATLTDRFGTKLPHMFRQERRK